MYIALVARASGWRRLKACYDPAQQISNVKFLRGELAGDNRVPVYPMEIDHRNPAQPKADEYFETDKAACLKELDSKIATMEADRSAGRPITAFPRFEPGRKRWFRGASDG